LPADGVATSPVGADGVPVAGGVETGHVEHSVTAAKADPPCNIPIMTPANNTAEIFFLIVSSFRVFVNELLRTNPFLCFNCYFKP
jgi:hypothetical protein